MYYRKILIADDDTTILKLYTSVLTKKTSVLQEDFILETFENGIALLERFKSEWNVGNRIPLCILDMNMPGMDGLETAREIRNIDSNVIIIIVTAYATTSLETLKESLKQNIYYIRKPFNKEEIYCLTDSLVKGWNKNFEVSKYKDQLEELVIKRTGELKTVIQKLEHEIANRIHIEKSLRESEERYRHITDTITDYIYTVYLQNNIPVNTVHGPACIAITGYRTEEFDFNPYLWLQMVPEEDRKIVKDYALQILTGGNVRPVEHRIIHKDGSVRWIRNTPVLHYDKLGKLLSYDGLVQDITERKQAEEALHDRLAMEELATIISSYFINLPFPELDREIICALQSIGEFVGVDRCFISLYSMNYKKLELIYEWCNNEVKHGANTTFLEHVFSDAEKLRKFDHLYISSVSFFDGETAIDKALLRSSGIKSVLIIPLRFSNNQTGCFGLYSEKSEKIWKEEDIRLLKMVGEIFVHALERKQAEEELKKYRDRLEYLVAERTAELTKATDQLIRSERLAATGQLAASIAHEINSPLQAITVLLSNLKHKYKDDDYLSDNIEILRDAFASIRDTVKNLLDLNRPGKEKKQPVDINKIIENTISLLKSYLKKNCVKISLNLSEKVPVIIASPQQLGQVFVNLINNAIEAMSVPSNKNKIFIETDFEKEYVIIRIKDTGSGIHEEELKNIFDPFYTRKKVMGMGVGLTICHGIIEEHKGTIEARNAIDGGAEFIITLPLKQTG
ncbi:MAG: ATP-binding protein [Candidatus Eremiobacterota bacterium]